jgi:hypothetical protein
MWKSAWAEGCHAGWHGVVKDEVPYRNGPQRDAWSAGWHWAETHPSATPERSISIPERQNSEPSGPSVFRRAAGGGALGVAFIAAARWLWRSRGQSVSATAADASPHHAAEDSSGNGTPGVTRS